MINVQTEYLRKLMARCKEGNIPLLLVNMPLSEENRQLMSAGFYADYLNRLKQICSADNVQFADLNTKPWSDNSNFVDTVHLKPEISNQFVNSLAEAVAHSSVSLALKNTPVATRNEPSVH